MSHVSSGDVLGIGAAIRRAREARGLSKRALAAKLGVDRKTVLNWEENGQVPTRPEILVAIEKELELSRAELSKATSRQTDQLRLLTDQVTRVLDDLRDLQDRVRELEARRLPPQDGR